MCGKDPCKTKSGPRVSGSPPHVRERLADVAYSCIAGGITSACAGKTAFVATDPNTVRDHPRMCGKDDCNYIIYRALKGSPPHVRERLATAFVTMLIMRITPACAGKTTYDIYQYTIYKDHPRMCGKDVISQALIYALLGSPPHVRERQNVGMYVNAYWGITPACAGKTSHTPESRCSSKDHPRMCGKDAV